MQVLHVKRCLTGRLAACSTGGIEFSDTVVGLKNVVANLCDCFFTKFERSYVLQTLLLLKFAVYFALTNSFCEVE